MVTKSERGRLRRLLHLVEILQSGRQYNTRQLAEHCQVSRRTIFRDLVLLQEAGVQVVYASERQTYFIPSKPFLPPTDLTTDEALSLLILCQALGDTRFGIPFQGGAQSAAVKLAAMLPSRLRAQAALVGEAVAIQIDPHNPLETERPIYQQLLECSTARRAARITYASLSPREEVRTKLCPYRLLYSRRSWYVIGRSSFHRGVRVFNLSRIKQLEVLEDQFVIPPRFSVEQFLGNAWHLIREPRDVAVRVRFHPRVAQNVAEVRWHRTQGLTWNADGSLDFTATVAGLSEFSWWLLGYGSYVEALEPVELRELLLGHVTRMHQFYVGKVKPT